MWDRPPGLSTPDRRRWLVWLLISLAGVAAGLRFFPRYYFRLLPVVVLLAARGFAEMRGRRRWIALLLLIPLVRFAPTYFQAARNDGWRDTAMDRDSRAAANIVNSLQKRETRYSSGATGRRSTCTHTCRPRRVFSIRSR